VILVEDAIQRARLTVKMPATLILLALVGQALMLYPSGLLPKPAALASLFLAILAWPLSLLWRAVTGPRWKLWAYPQVGNPPQLRAIAVGMKLIPTGNSLMEKMEICSAGERQRILTYEGRL
jgi:hypothetical protein